MLSRRMGPAGICYIIQTVLDFGLWTLNHTRVSCCAFVCVPCVIFAHSVAVFCSIWDICGILHICGVHCVRNRAMEPPAGDHDPDHHDLGLPGADTVSYLPFPSQCHRGHLAFAAFALCPCLSVMGSSFVATSLK